VLRGLICGLLLGFASMAWAETEHNTDEASGKIVILTTAIGTTLDAYLVGPETAKKSVLILHDRWGLDETAKIWADRFAAQGYLALAVDLYDGRMAKKSDAEHASLIVSQIDPEWSVINVKAGISFLARKTGQKTAVLGWGFGGSLAFKATQLGIESLASAVMLYGQLPTELEELRKVTSPIFGVFSTSDERLSIDELDQVGVLMGKLSNPFVSFEVNAAPGFVDQSLPVYDEDATELAWQRSLEFLNGTL